MAPPEAGPPPHLGGEPPPASPIEEPDERSLGEDVEALFQDGKTYLEAEVAFQKNRGVFAGRHAKSAAIFGVIAATFVFFAVMGLVFGLILALAPLITAWGSTAVVVGALLLGAYIALRRAVTHSRAISEAFKSEEA